MNLFEEFKGWLGEGGVSLDFEICDPPLFVDVNAVVAAWGKEFFPHLQPVYQMQAVKAVLENRRSDYLESVRVIQEHERKV